MNLNKNNSEKIDLCQLVNRLKSEDIRYAKISKAIQFIYLILIPVYGTLSFIDYKELGDINIIFGGVCLIISFLIFALFFRKFYKEYNYVDYSLPTLQMLKKAAYRYQPFQIKKLWLVIALIIMDIGLGLSSTTFSGLENQLIFLGLIIGAALIGIVIWNYRYKPLRDKALELIASIEGE